MSVQRKNEDQFVGFGVRLMIAIHSASAGSVSQTDPVGGAVAGSLESRGIDQCLQ